MDKLVKLWVCFQVFLGWSFVVHAINCMQPTTEFFGNNVQFSYQSYKVSYAESENASVECIIYFVKISGTYNITCVNGSWSWLGGTALVCVAGCPAPSLTTGVSVADPPGTTYPNGSMIHLKCIDGYTPKNGNDTGICVHNGAWGTWIWTGIASSLNCDRVCVNGPTVGAGAQLSTGHLMPYVQYINYYYECAAGYSYMSGGTSAVCLIDSFNQTSWTWNSYPPIQCSSSSSGAVAATCPAPSLDMYTIINGTVRTTYNATDTINLQCLLGFLIPWSGDATGTCSSLGNWTWVSGSPLQCKLGCNDVPQVPQSIALEASTAPWLAGTNLTVTCATGYQNLVGDSIIYCDSDLTSGVSAWHWDTETEPSCEPVSSVTTGIVGGDVVAVTYGTQHTFDSGSLTADAANPGSLSGLTFVWMCRRQCESWLAFSNGLPIGNLVSACIPVVALSAPGCFSNSSRNNGTGILQQGSSGTLVFNTTDLVRDILVFQVTVIKGNQSANATQLVSFVDPGALPVTVTCLRNCKESLNVEDQLSLQASLPDSISASWFWQVNKLLANSSIVAVLPSAWLPFCTTGANSSGIAISSGFWKTLQPDDRIMLSVTGVPSYSTDGIPSTEYYAAIIASPPSPGNCTITPTNGTALSTMFTITCTAFATANGPLTFELGVSTDGASYSWLRKETSLRALGQGIQLPEGLSQNNYNVNLSVKATDIIGMSANASLTAVVQSTSDAAIQNIISVLANGSLLSSIGFDSSKPTQALAFVGAVALTLNSKSSLSSSANSSAVPSQQLTAARERLTSILKDVPIVGVSSAIQVQSVLANVLNGAKEIGNIARTSAVTILENGAVVTSNTSSGPPSSSQLGGALQTSLTCADHLLSANTYAVSSNPSSATDVSGRVMNAIGKHVETLWSMTAVGDTPAVVKTSSITVIAAKQSAADFKTGASKDDNGSGLTLPDLAVGVSANLSVAVQSQVVVFTENPFLPANGKSPVDSGVVMVKVASADPNISLATENTPKPTHVLSTRALSGMNSSANATMQGVATVLKFPSAASTSYKLSFSSNDSLYIAFDWFRVRSSGNSSTAVTGVLGSRLSAANYSLVVYLSIGGTPSPQSYDFNCTLPVILRYNATTNITSSISGGAYSSTCENATTVPCFGEAVYSTNSWFPNGDAANVDTKTCFIPSTWLKRKSGSALTIAVYYSETDTRGGIIASNTTASGNLTVAFIGNSYSQRCIYWNQFSKSWISEGCVSGPLASPNTSHCICTRLSVTSATPTGRRKRSGVSQSTQTAGIAFGSGLTLSVNAPNLKDSAFNHLDDNPLMFSVLLSIICIYFCALIWAIKMDRLDEEKAAVLPLIDNKQSDKYLYEITVYTGSMMRAGTSANVCMIFAGDDGDSGARIFCSRERPIFSRGGIDSFLMAVPKSLGSLSYLRVWHDNTGPNPSWFLSRVVVVDLQTSQKFYFVINKWLSEVDDDCMRCRLIIVAGRGDLTAFSNMFWMKARKDLVDGHLWFSVVGRPHTSRFTRVQRCTCCIALLFSLMTANIMFYGKVVTANIVIKLGPITISVGQILQGIIASLVVLPLNIIIVQIFRKAEPMLVRRVMRMRKQKVGIDMRPPENEAPVTAANWIRLSQNAATWMKDPVVKSDDNSFALWQLVMSADRPGAASSESESQVQKAPITVNLRAPATADLKRITVLSRKKLWPWWTIFIAYFLAFAICAVSFWYVVEIGFVLGQEKAIKWLTSFITSIIESICLSQPIKVMVRAVIFALIVKKPAHDEDSIVHRGKREAYLEKHIAESRKKIFAFMQKMRQNLRLPVPPPTETVQQVEKKRIRERQTLQILKEIGVYLIFIILMMLTSYGNLDKNSEQSYRDIENAFRFGLKGQTKYIPFWLDDAHNYELVWRWINDTVLPSLYEDHSVNNSNIFVNYELRLPKGYNRVRSPRLRQYRLKDGHNCDYKLHNKTLCYGDYISSPEDRSSYGAGWSAVASASGTASTYASAWTWTSEDSGRGYSLNGDVGVYPGSGYALSLGNTSRDSIAAVAYLKKNEWIDRRTRALCLEFTVYNPSTNLLGVSFIFLEFLALGVCRPRYGMTLLRYEPYPEGLLVTLMAEIGSMVFVAYFAFTEFRLLSKQKSNYFRSFGNLLNMTTVLFCFAAIFLFLAKVSLHEETKNSLMSDSIEKFVNFQSSAYWHECYRGCLGITTFAATLKFLRLLRFNTRISMLTTTLKSVTPRLLSLLTVMLLVFFAFAHMTFLVYGNVLDIYRTFISTCLYLLVLMMNKFDYGSVEEANPVFAPIFLLAFVVIINFTIINVMMTIIMEGFQDTRNSFKDKKNKYEVLQLIVEMFKTTSGLGAKTQAQSDKDGAKKLLQLLNEDSSKLQQSNSDPLSKMDVACKQLHRKFKKFVDPAPKKRITYSEGQAVKKNVLG